MAAPASVSRNWLCLLLCGWPTGSETRGVSRAWAWQTQLLCSAHEEATQAPMWRHQMAPHFSGPSVNSLSLGFASWPKFLAEKRPQSGDSLGLSVTDRLKGTKPSLPLSEEAFGTSSNFYSFLLHSHVRHFRQILLPGCWGSVPRSQGTERAGFCLRVAAWKMALWEPGLILSQAFHDYRRDQEPEISHLLGYTDNWSVLWNFDRITFYLLSHGPCGDGPFYG